jgi:hypothetical protein
MSENEDAIILHSLHSMLNGTTKADKSASNTKAKGRR